MFLNTQKQIEQKCILSVLKPGFSPVLCPGKIGFASICTCRFWECLRGEWRSSRGPTGFSTRCYGEKRWTLSRTILWLLGLGKTPFPLRASVPPLWYWDPSSLAPLSVARMLGDSPTCWRLSILCWSRHSLGVVEAELVCSAIMHKLVLGQERESVCVQEDCKKQGLSLCASLLWKEGARAGDNRPGALSDSQFLLISPSCRTATRREVSPPWRL